MQIVQIGDSHTANDGFSGRLRELFQARYGNGGRGMLPPGIPFQFFKPAQVAVTAEGWDTIGSLKSANPGPFGITGVRQHAGGAATMTLRSTTPDGLGDVVVEAYGQAGGGTIELAWDGGQPLSFSTNAAPGPLWFTMPPGQPGAGLTLRARGDGPVDLLSWTTTLPRAGVAYSNLGTIGATIDLVGRWDYPLVRAELARLHPALMLVAFGTNEGFMDDRNLAAYPADYARHVQALHDAAPYAAIIIIGPPDGTRAAAPGDLLCPAAGNWTVPRHLAPVRDAEKAYAASKGYFYWDWSAAMGGPCSMARWAAMVPPMASADHLHLVRLGYRATAEQLFDEIMKKK